MSTRVLTPELLHSWPAGLDGMQFSIEGLLFVTSESAYVTISNNGNEMRVPVSDETFIERLLGDVPCYLGGNYLYHDSVRLVGFLSLVKDSNSAAISKVESGLISRDGDEFSF